MMQETHGFEIAIVGMAGRFPGADDVDAYWRNIEAGIESVRSLSGEELDDAGLAARAADPDYLKYGAFLENVDAFDADLFGYSAQEARLMDPQQRLFLETAWQALEHAGCAPDQFAGSIGVFAGSSLGSYLIHNVVNNREVLRQIPLSDLLHENNPDLLATRVSYKLKLTGPSVVVGTACSTSLVLVHYACQSLLAGDCDVALAGGVRIGVPHKSGYDHAEGGIMSRDGRCRTFDVRASGTVAGNGVGVVILKRLQNALANGDTIHAVIKGTAVNNDGARKVGFTAPSVDGQAEVIRKALIAAGVPAESIGYLEAHGTATRLGDPVEIKALTQAYRGFTGRRQFCAVGAVKANIGHLDTAAGVAGLIKVAQLLKHGVLPPSVNFEAPNPEIDFEQTPFYVLKQRQAWRSPAIRRAALSAFGIGGTNAHAILEESRFAVASGASRALQLLCFSGKTAAALRGNVENFRNWLQASDETAFADAAYTLQAGRTALQHRCSFLCKDKADALALLSGGAPGTQSLAKLDGGPLVFMFSGQGAQYPGMTQGLYESETVFKDMVDRCAALLAPHLHLDIRDILFPAAATNPSDGPPSLYRTRYTQPALFVVEYALVTLLAAWGVRPKACIGHSIGEYVAACVAGVFSLEDALALVAARAAAMDEMPPGAMLAVELPEAGLADFLTPETCIAALNGPDLTVVSGELRAITALEERLAAAGITAKRLHTSHAFHSAMMDGCLEKFAGAFAAVELRAPCVPFISNVSGDWITAEQATSAQYWLRQLRSPVAFSAGIHRLLEDDSAVLLEAGPGSTLTGLALLHATPERKGHVLSTVRDAKRQVGDSEMLLGTLGRLWCLGVKVTWAGFYAQEQRRRIPLPTYAFQRQRYWLENTDRSPRAVMPASGRLPMECWFHRLAWTQAGRTDDLGLPGGKVWLLFLDGLKVGKRLERRLVQADGIVWTVRKAREFKYSGQRRVAMNPARAADYVKLFALLEEHRAIPDKIIHCGSVGAGRKPAASRYEDYEALLHIARAFPRHDAQRAVELYVVSNQLHDLTGGGRFDPARSLLIGPCKVIPKEFGHIRCKSIDIALGRKRLIGPASGIDIDTLAAELTWDAQECFVALRGRQRFVQMTVQSPLPAAAGSLFRHNGVYLITGGFGGIGATLARFLAERYQARLILTARTELPPQREWQQWRQEHDVANEKSRRIRLLEELRAAGGTTHVIAGDVADIGRMKKALSAAERLLGPVVGVFHCAGVADGALIQRRTLADSEAVLRSKVTGTQALEKLLRHRSLDCFVLCSSLASLIGPVGQVAYCSANAFQDAFAQSRGGRGATRYLAVAWDSWQEAGMAVDTLGHGPDGLREIAHGIRPNEGLDVLRRALANQHNHYFISTRGLPLPQSGSVEPDAAAQAAADERPGWNTLHSRPELSAAFVAPRDEIEARIGAIWQDKLGVGPLGVFDDFFELNGHSLLAVQIVAEIRRQLRITLPAGLIYDNSTIARLAQSVAQRMPTRTGLQQAAEA